MKQAAKNLELLGLKATDKVTGLKGIITSISFDLYGCIQACLNRGFKKNGERHESYWFDLVRLEVSDERVLELPNFDKGYVSQGKKGPVNKSIIQNSKP